MADDPKVKELIAGDAPLSDVVDAATRAELERWFGLPSFEQVAETKRAEDPDIVARREQQEKAMAAVDPGLIAAHRRRVEVEILIPRPDVKTSAGGRVARIDLDRIDQMYTAIAEPRELELPDELRDDMAHCTPQALLRDLHRPETDFYKAFEIVDMAAEQRFDGPAHVREIMATSWKAQTLPVLPYIEALAISAELRGIRRAPWTDIARPNRRMKD